MEKTEDILLEKLRIFTNSKSGTTIQEKLYNLTDDENEQKDKKTFACIISYIIEGNEIIKDELLGFKEIICQKFIEILNGGKYESDLLINIFLNVDNEYFEKIMNISWILSLKLNYSIFDILFWILINKYFDNLKKILENIGITGFENKEMFVERIYYNNRTTLKNALKNNNLDINSFLALDNNYYLKFIENNESKESNDENNKNEIKEQQNFESIIEDDKMGIFINEIAKDNKDNIIKERKERISKLINKSIIIKLDKNLKEEDDNILNYNYQKINDNNLKKDNIIIDEYEIKKDKNLYLFSPVSLLINGIKKELQINDFEIFNKNNYYVEVYGNYLKEIIIKLNEYINNGKENEYIEENKIKFGSYHNHFYLCCIFNQKFKDEYYRNKYLNKNSLIDNCNNPETKKIKINNSEEKEKEEEKKEVKSTYSTAKYSKDNLRNRTAYNLENDVKELIVSNKNDELQNLLFFFNLKVPKKTDTIEFESVTIFFNTFYNNLYGFREIDLCSKKNKGKLSDVFENNYSFSIRNGKFCKNKEETIDVEIKDNTILFCEIKSCFPIITSGSEKYFKIQINNDKNKLTENNYSLTFIDQLENLIKKAKIFFSFFQKEGIIDERTCIHIIYIYDETNINMYADEIDDILKSIINYFEEPKLPKDFKNAIFQMAYFNKEKNEKNKIKKLLDKKSNETYEKCKKENEDTIEKLKKENEDTIEKLKKENEDNIEKLKKENEDTIEKLKKEVQEKDEEIKKLKEIIEKSKKNK